MVLMLLSTIGPCSPSSVSSPLSPTSIHSSATSSSFFAILSPLFDQNGPEDDQSVSTPTAPSAGAELADASSAVAASFGTEPFSPRIPSLMPPSLRPRRPANTRMARSGSNKALDKVLPPLPPTPNSPRSPSKLRTSRTMPVPAEKMPVPSSEIHETYRGRFSSVPSVHVSKPQHARTKTIAEVVDAQGSYVVRAATPVRQQAALPSLSPPTSAPDVTSSPPRAVAPMRKLFSMRAPKTLRNRRQNSEDESRLADLSVAMAGVDLDVFPSPTSSGPGTPPSAQPINFASISSQGSGTTDLGSSVFDHTPKSSFSSMSTFDGGDRYADAEDDSMEIPIAIEVPLAMEPRIVLPRLVMDAVPPMPAEGPTSSTRRSISCSASTIAQRRQSVYQPLSRMRSLKDDQSISWI